MAELTYINVRNVTTHNVGVTTFLNGNWNGFNIKPDGILKMHVDDIQRLKNECTLFQDGELVLEMEKPEVAAFAEAVGIESVEQVALSDVEIEKMLKGKAANLKAWVEEQKPWDRGRIYDMAVLMDLPQSKMRIVQELMPIEATFAENKRLEEEEKAAEIKSKKK
jgi:hypothetical protein